MNDSPRLGERPTGETSATHLFIPDICQTNALFLLLILTQLMAFILTLIQSHSAVVDWALLGLISIFCHSVVLCCSALICGSRSLLAKFSTRIVTLSCLTIIIAVTFCLSLASLRFTTISGSENAEHFLTRNILISLILGCLMLRYFYLQQQWRQQKQAELQAKLQALQARIRPHFLFNSMNTIASLISIDPLKAEDAIVDLSTLFRATLNNQSMLVPLKEELDLCKRYLNIEGLRLGDRLKLEWDVADNMGQVRIPPLTLQPLMENAIYHGIQPLTEGGTVKLKSYLKDSKVTILISNPYDSQREVQHGNQIALANIRSRLSGIYDHKAILKTSQLDNIFTVTLRFPINAKAE